MIPKLLRSNLYLSPKALLVASYTTISHFIYLSGFFRRFLPFFFDKNSHKSGKNTGFYEKPRPSNEKYLHSNQKSARFELFF
jgi:hypothetical protein